MFLSASSDLCQAGVFFTLNVFLYVRTILEIFKVPLIHQNILFHQQAAMRLLTILRGHFNFKMESKCFFSLIQSEGGKRIQFGKVPGA